MQQVNINIWRNPIYFLAFGFGSGLLPKAPGTFGTLVAIPLYLLLSQLALTWYLIVTLLGLVMGIYLCEVTSRALKVHDHSGIVWDEIIGFFITMVAAPAGWLWIALGFVLFRVFDIWKPWPIKIVDKYWQGGFGVMFDDVIAGIYAGILLQLIRIIVGD